MNSLDTEHVNPNPDPAELWEFTKGCPVVIGRGAFDLELELIKVGAGRARFVMRSRDRTLTDWLELDRPCVALRLPDHQPAVTFTLRRIGVDKQAFVQVSAHPALQVTKRW